MIFKYYYKIDMLFHKFLIIRPKHLHNLQNTQAPMTKTQIVLMSTRYMLDRIDLGSISPLTFNNASFPFCQRAENLGLHMTCDFSWESRVFEISRKVFATAHSLKQLQYFIPFKAKLMLVSSLLILLDEMKSS